MNSKSKMVSFRLSADEYLNLRQACEAAGVPSISFLARAAMQHLLASQSLPLDDEVRELRARIARISAEVDVLACLVEKAKASSS
jgi:hypothetical protein